MGNHRARLVVLSVVALLAGRAAAGVIVVAPQGQAFTQISTAVAAASDGDVILVKSGIYSPVTVSGKSVTIVADVDAWVLVAGPINIINLPAGKTVVLDGMKSDGGWVTPQTHGLLIINCLGAVRVQQGEFTAGSGIGSIDDDCDITGMLDAPNAVRVYDSSNVSLVGCLMTGGEGASIWSSDCHIQEDTIMIGGSGGHGLELWDASATVYDSTIQGGASGAGGYSEDAGHGAWVENWSRLVLVGSQVHGGSGGQSFDGIAPAPGGDGGRGVSVYGSSEVRLLDNELVGGVQGPGWGIPGGLPAEAIGGGGVVTTWSGVAPSLDLSTLVREGQITSIQVAGSPGDVALLFLSLQTVAVPAPHAKGTFILNPAPLLGPIVLGMLGGGGLVSIAATMPALPAGLLSAGIYLQATLASPSGATLSSWGHLTVLDASL